MHPGWLEKLLTHPVKGLENFRELLGHLTAGNGVIKAYCEVAAVWQPGSGWTRPVSVVI